MATVNDLASINLWGFIIIFVVFFILITLNIIVGNSFGITEIYYIGILFFMVTFIFQVSSNIYITGRPEVCGKTDMNLSFSSTIYPWLFIFGTTICLIMLIPGWLRVFSNTFGLYCAKANGLKEFLDLNIFSQQTKPAISPTQDIQLLKTIDSVYSDPCLLINELDPRTCNFEYDADKKLTSVKWESFDKIVQSGVIRSDFQFAPDILKELYEKVMLKEAVGYFSWFFLSGIISVIVSTNLLLNQGCNSKIKTDYKHIFNN